MTNPTWRAESPPLSYPIWLLNATPAPMLFLQERHLQFYFLPPWLIPYGYVLEVMAVLSGCAQKPFIFGKGRQMSPLHGVQPGSTPCSGDICLHRMESSQGHRFVPDCLERPSPSMLVFSVGQVPLSSTFFIICHSHRYYGEMADLAVGLSLFFSFFCHSVCPQ